MIRLARTVADLDRSDAIAIEHVEEALTLRRRDCGELGALADPARLAGLSGVPRRPRRTGAATAATASGAEARSIGSPSRVRGDDRRLATGERLRAAGRRAARPRPRASPASPSSAEWRAGSTPPPTAGRCSAAASPSRCSPAVPTSSTRRRTATLLPSRSASGGRGDLRAPAGHRRAPASLSGPQPDHGRARAGRRDRRGGAAVGNADHRRRRDASSGAPSAPSRASSASGCAEGSNDLIKDGAHLIRDARDVLDLLFGVGAVGRRSRPRHRARAPALPWIARSPSSSTSSSRERRPSTGSPARADLAPRDAAVALARLELLGYVAADALGAYAPTGLDPP